MRLHAQQGGKRYRIGILETIPPEANAANLNALLKEERVTVDARRCPELWRTLSQQGYDGEIPEKPKDDGPGGGGIRLPLGWAKQGSRTPWRLHQNYIRDVLLMRRGSLEDEGMTFQRRSAAIARVTPSGHRRPVFDRSRPRPARTFSLKMTEGLRVAPE